MLSPSNLVTSHGSAVYQTVYTGYTPTDSSVYRVTVTAEDTFGHVAAATTDFYVEGFGPSEPIAEIISPLGHFPLPAGIGYEQQPIEQPTDLLGFAYDPDGNFYKFTLEYRLIGESDGTFILSTTGYAEVGANGTEARLGTIDPTVMENGVYEVRLLVYDLDGNVTPDIETYTVSGNLKIGNFTMSFTDMSIPLSGLPITVTRTYDSRVKTARDFCVGWKMELSTLKLTENDDMGVGWFGRIGSDNACVVEPGNSHAVSQVWPDGRTETFEMQIQHTPSGVIFGETCPTGRLIEAVSFDRTSIGTSKLELFGPLPFEWVPDSDVLGEGDGFGNDPPIVWAPQGYTLTAGDGTVYRFNKQTGAANRTADITQITDRNGNTLTLTTDGIEHSSGMSVAIIRDNADRVRKVVDPQQNSVTYDYDDRNDLTAVTDQEGNTTRFVYNSRHEITDVIDPRGLPVAKNVYDDEGRLIETVDAEGYKITYERDLDARTETITDRLGHITVFEYDANGNITKQIEKNVTFDGVVIPEIVTEFFYDNRGNQTKTIFPEDDPDPNNTSTTALDWLKI